MLQGFVVAVVVAFVLLGLVLLFGKASYAKGGMIIAIIFLFIITVTVIIPRLTATTEKPKDLDDYNAFEQRGRKIFTREGCYYCHSQFARVQDWDHGRIPKDIDYAYDAPNLLGTERTGPDLTNIGNKFPDEWHRAHHSDPRAVKPGSVMPSFSFLENENIYSRLSADEIAFLKSKNWSVERILKTDAMDALIAYLQSIGERGNRRVRALARQGLMLDREYIAGRPYAPEYIHKHLTEILDKAEYKGIKYELRFIKAGNGIFDQNCAVCHGHEGKGDGPAAPTMAKPPANFSDARFDTYGTEEWYFRVHEGVPGTQMPPWGKKLSDEQILYVVNFLRHVAEKNGLGELTQDKSLTQPDFEIPMGRGYQTVLDQYKKARER